MIVETFKLVTSIWPFIKEAFLWRDGAQVGKPITNQNLIRRKIAAFALLASLALNYLLGNHFYKDYVRLAELEKEVATIKAERDDFDKENDVLKLKLSTCIPVDNVVSACEHHVDVLEREGKIKRVLPKRKVK